MTVLYTKVVQEDGTETFVEQDLNEVELPETHKIVKAFNAVKAQRAAIKAKLNEGQAADDPSDPAQPTPKPEVPQQPAPVVIDEASIVEKAVKLLTAQQQAAQTAQTQRAVAIDTIIKETGLNPDLRSVIAEIPDLDAAKAQAVFLAGKGMVFQAPPSGGNGKQNRDDMFAKINANLFPENTNPKK